MLLLYTFTVFLFNDLNVMLNYLHSYKYLNFKLIEYVCCFRMLIVN